MKSHLQKKRDLLASRRTVTLTGISIRFSLRFNNVNAHLPGPGEVLAKRDEEGLCLLCNSSRNSQSSQHLAPQYVFYT